MRNAGEFLEVVQRVESWQMVEDIDRYIRLWGGLRNVYMEYEPELDVGVIAGWISEE